MNITTAKRNIERKLFLTKRTTCVILQKDLIFPKLFSAIIAIIAY